MSLFERNWIFVTVLPDNELKIEDENFERRNRPSFFKLYYS